MLPAAVVVVRRFPLTANGKLDRASLPAPGPVVGGRGGAPRTDAERVVARLFTEVLRLDEVGVEDRFFDLGGDIISALQLASRARRAGLALTPRQVFAHKSVAAIAAVAQAVTAPAVETREEAIGAMLPELIVPPEDREQFWWLLERFTTGERADKMLDLRVERTGLHRDGHTFPIELAATTIRHEHGVTLHTFMHDISERRRDRRALESHAADLKALAEASAELARSTTAVEARESICRAAGRISEAEVAVLMEPTKDGRGLRVTAAVGAEGDDLTAWVLPLTAIAWTSSTGTWVAPR
jgi:PAS domain S-box-containing protein